jgi:hypothetical protein
MKASRSAMPALPVDMTGISFVHWRSHWSACPDVALCPSVGPVLQASEVG